MYDFTEQQKLAQHCKSTIIFKKGEKDNSEEFPGGLAVKDLALSFLWFRSLLWHRFDTWPGNFHMLCAWPKKKKGVAFTSSVSWTSRSEYFQCILRFISHVTLTNVIFGLAGFGTSGLAFLKLCSQEKLISRIKGFHGQMNLRQARVNKVTMTYDKGLVRACSLQRSSFIYLATIDWASTCQVLGLHLWTGSLFSHSKWLKQLQTSKFLNKIHE